MARSDFRTTCLERALNSRDPASCDGHGTHPAARREGYSTDQIEGPILLRQLQDLMRAARRRNDPVRGLRLGTWRLEKAGERFGAPCKVRVAEHGRATHAPRPHSPGGDSNVTISAFLRAQGALALSLSAGAIPAVLGSIAGVPRPHREVRARSGECNLCKLRASPKRNGRRSRPG